MMTIEIPRVEEDDEEDDDDDNDNELELIAIDDENGCDENNENDPLFDIGLADGLGLGDGVQALGDGLGLGDQDAPLNPLPRGVDTLNSCICFNNFHSA